MIHSKPFDAILFDMDGTLVDSTAIVECIWTAFATRHNLSPAEVLHFAHGRPTSATVSHFIYDAETSAAEVSLVAAAEATETTGVREIPGARAILATLLDGSWAVVTSATRQITHLRMAAAGLPIPPLLITSEDVQHGKPSPEGYQLAASKLGADISRCLIFEDAGPGIAAGMASGGTVVVVGGYHDERTSGLLRIHDFMTASLRDGVLYSDVPVAK